MKLIEFEFINGGKVYVNPALVRYVTADTFNEGVSIISYNEAEIHVKGDPESVCAKLVRGYSV